MRGGVYRAGLPVEKLATGFLDGFGGVNTAMTEEEAQKLARILAAAIGAVQVVNDPNFVLGVVTGMATKEFPGFAWIELISREEETVQKHVRDVKRIL